MIIRFGEVHLGEKKLSGLESYVVYCFIFNIIRPLIFVYIIAELNAERVSITSLSKVLKFSVAMRKCKKWKFITCNIDAYAEYDININNLILLSVTGLRKIFYSMSGIVDWSSQIAFKQSYVYI